MRWLWLLYWDNIDVQLRDKLFSGKTLTLILVKEIVMYTGKSPLEAPLILRDIETIPYQYQIKSWENKVIYSRGDS